MGLHGDGNIQVPLRAALDAVFALVRETQAHAGFDPAGNLHGEHAFLADTLPPAAGLAGFGDDLSDPFALTAGPADAEKTLLEPELALSLAGRAHFNGRG